MCDFEALGERLAKKHGLVAIPRYTETSYFLIQDTKFAWTEVVRTFKSYHYIVFFNTPENVQDVKFVDYSYCYRYDKYRMQHALNMNWPDEINNQFKQEHFGKYPLIDIEDCLDKMLVLARKDLNELLIDIKKSEIKGAGSKYIL